jgi:hypothetical protein
MQDIVSAFGNAPQLREVYQHLCKTRIGHKLPQYWRALHSRTRRFSELLQGKNALLGLTSLTGIEDTPTSVAMNQQALVLDEYRKPA